MNINRWMQAGVLLVGLAAFAIAADITGTWTATFDTQVGVQPYTFVLKQEGTKLTGVAKNAFAKAETPITEGTVTGNDIAFVENLNYEGMPLRITYKGKIAGDSIELVRNVLDIADEKATAKRSK